MPMPPELPMPRMTRAMVYPKWRPQHLADVTAERVRRGAYDDRRKAARAGDPPITGDTGFRYFRLVDSVLEPELDGDPELVPGDTVPEVSAPLPGADPVAVAFERMLKNGRLLTDDPREIA